MRKIFLSIFVAILMLMMPIVSSTNHLNNNEKNINESNVKNPIFKINQTQNILLDNFIAIKFDGEEEVQANTIKNNIINSNLEINMIELALAANVYNPQPIDMNKLIDLDTFKINVGSWDELNQLIEDNWKVENNQIINELFGDLIDYIVGLIKGRLGWVYILFKDGIKLVEDGIDLFIEIIQPMILQIAVYLVAVVNLIIAIPQLFKDMITELFSGDYEEFIDTIIDYKDETAQTITEIINFVNDIINNQKISNYLYNVTDFISWFDSNPWEDPIHISGQVIQNFGFLSGATVSCKNSEDITDENGEFSFTVQYQPSSDSIPANKSYGLHKCIISVSKDGETLKQSKDLLSYAFSGGYITWTFIVIKGKNKILSLKNLIQRIFTNIFELIQTIFQKIKLFNNTPLFR